ncbi:MAG: hypothetical protein U0235_20810 [Polyangiaceae bacterium]
MAVAQRPFYSVVPDPFGDASHLDSASEVPIPTRSESRLRPAAQPVTDELFEVAERFRNGDFHGALLGAMHVLDESPVPIVKASPTYLAKAKLGPAERILIALVDGATDLEELFEASGLGLLEGIDAICGLIDADVVTLDPGDRNDPQTLPG